MTMMKLILILIHSQRKGKFIIRRSIQRLSAKKVRYQMKTLILERAELTRKIIVAVKSRAQITMKKKVTTVALISQRGMDLLQIIIKANKTIPVMEEA